MLAAVYVFGVMFLPSASSPTSGSPTPTPSCAVDEELHRLRPVRPAQAEGTRWPLPRSRRPTRRSATSSWSCIHVVVFGLIIFLWGVWQNRGDAKPSTEVADQHLRPSAGEGRPSAHGTHRRQPADDAVHRRVPTRRGRRRLPVEGGQAEAVHPHRPVRVHHVRGLRRHLPVEVHPHGHARRHRRGDRHRAAGRGSRATRSSSSSTTTSAPAARCASTAARPA